MGMRQTAITADTTRIRAIIKTLTANTTAHTPIQAITATRIQMTAGTAEAIKSEHL